VFDVPSVIVEPEKRYKSFTPYWRNDNALVKEFGTRVINGWFDTYKNEKIRNIIISYASFWSDWQSIAKFITEHPESQIYRLLNEYGVFPLNSGIAKVVDQNKIIIVANFPQMTERCLNHIQINLNTLIFDPEIAPKGEEKVYRAIYYGMYRKDRAVYFTRYFDENIVVSTSRKNILLFKQLGVTPIFAKQFYWGRSSALERFRFSLYLEDEYTHTHYNFPANRFYEGLMFGVVQLFDVNCQETFRIAGYDIKDYLVKDSASLRSRMDSIEKDYQWHVWNQAKWKERATTERAIAIEKLRPIFE
jgi:hypothetical protein